LGLGLSLGFNSRTLKSSAHVPADLVTIRGVAAKTPPHIVYMDVSMQGKIPHFPFPLGSLACPNDGSLFMQWKMPFKIEVLDGKLNVHKIEEYYSLYASQ
jgi:hypothetical protein